MAVHADNGMVYDPAFTGFSKINRDVHGLVFNQVLPLPNDDYQIGDGCEVAASYIVSGRVLGYDGQPVSGVTIHNGEESNIVAVTGPDGVYSASFEALTDLFLRPEIGEQHFEPAAQVYPRLICNKGEVDFHFAQTPSFRVGGQVVYTGNYPASGVTVAVVYGDNSYYSTTTDQQGYYDLFVPDGLLARVIVARAYFGCDYSSRVSGVLRR